jgi:hypothetical protein
MTEADWLRCTGPDEMHVHLRERQRHRCASGRRKLRLFGCACSHRVERFLTKKGRTWLELAERSADGLVKVKERNQAASSKGVGPVSGQRADDLADFAAWFTLQSDIMIAAQASAAAAVQAVEIDARHRGADLDAASLAERTEQASLLRDIFGNPFREVHMDVSWLGGTTAPYRSWHKASTRSGPSTACLSSPMRWRTLAAPTGKSCRTAAVRDRTSGAATS